MSSRIQYEAWLMVLSLVTGGWLMLAYDTLRVFRLVIRHWPLLDRGGGFFVLALCGAGDLYSSL